MRRKDLPRPNRGYHLWRLRENGIYYARIFRNSQAYTHSLGTDDFEEAARRLLTFTPPEKARQTIDFGCIYVIAWSPDGPVKIGKARKPDIRLTELQCGCPYKLKVMHHGQRHPSGLATIESRIHASLADKRMHREWFNISVAEATKAIRLAEMSMAPGTEHQETVI
jgi:hypothetical protein